MCGIVGFWNANLSNADAQQQLARMCATVVHRGPDDQGTLWHRPVGIGVRRLSIVDVAHGHQPIGNEDGSIQVVFNGEIYNHVELRAELERLGHRFTTVGSDTEAIVHAYEAYGTACFERLWGMFSVAIWDGRRRKLILARDRFGKKPLFYVHSGSRLSFASEMKALLVDAQIPRDIDLAVLDQYFTFGYIAAPRSIFQSIRKLRPASFLTFDGQRTEIERYWQLRVGMQRRITEREAIDEIRRLLEDAVRVRLMSEVPLGAFLSGGIDSSAVVAYMSELMSSPVKTFSIGFDEREYNELEHAQTVAEMFGTEHTAEIVRPDVVAILPDLLRAFDEPFADESVLPTYYVSRLARQHVTVALSGDGGDEAFGGYLRYSSALRDAHRRLDVPGLARLAARLPDGTRGKTRLLGLTLSPEARYVESSAIFHSRGRRSLYTPEVRESLDPDDPYTVQLDRFAETPGLHLLSRMQYVDVHTYLADDILAKVDRASMWTSLETRAPFLDHRLFEFALTLPPDYLVRGTGKFILKQALRGRVPDRVLDRRKMGFGVPLERWFRTELHDFATQLLFDGALRSRGIIDDAHAQELWRNHQSGRHNNSRRLWALVCFEMWCRIYVDAPVAVPA
jgi:asparagine synthase (glutamine-hydrolysing)